MNLLLKKVRKVINIVYSHSIVIRVGIYIICTAINLAGRQGFLERERLYKKILGRPNGMYALDKRHHHLLY